MMVRQYVQVVAVSQGGLWHATPDGPFPLGPRSKGGSKYCNYYFYQYYFQQQYGVLVCKVSLEVACRALASCSWLNVASCGVGELLSLKKAPIGVATLITGAMMMTMMMTMMMRVMMRVMMTVLTRVMCPPPRRGRVLRAWGACDRGEVGVSSNGSAPQNLTRPRFQVSRPYCEST